MNQEIVSFLKTALECSVLVEPLDPGLTFDELIEIGNRAGYQNGEINDAMGFVTTQYFGRAGHKLLPNDDDLTSWVFLFLEEPEYRNFDAFDFVVSELNALTRSQGAGRALIERSILVERGVASRCFPYCRD
jgi:hypothetical protein